MSKLVRARPKRPEDMPEWAKCCAEFMDWYQQLGELTVDISAGHVGHRMICSACKAHHPDLRGVPDIRDGQLVALELLDLDEGAA